MSKVNIRCKIPTIYHLQSQVYLPAAVFAKIIQRRHNLFWISTQRSLRKKSWCWAVLSMTEILDLPATSGDIFKEKSLLISPIVSAMCTHTHTHTHRNIHTCIHIYIYIYIYIYSVRLYFLSMCVVICISAHTYIHICIYINKHTYLKCIYIYMLNIHMHTYYIYNTHICNIHMHCIHNVLYICFLYLKL